jgi:hypothetical protein
VKSDLPQVYNKIQGVLNVVCVKKGGFMSKYPRFCQKQDKHGNPAEHPVRRQPRETPFMCRKGRNCSVMQNAREENVNYRDKKCRHYFPPVI